MFHVPQSTHEQSNLMKRIRYRPALFKLNSVFHMSECANDRTQLIPLNSYSGDSKAKESQSPTFVSKR